MHELDESGVAPIHGGSATGALLLPETQYMSGTTLARIEITVNDDSRYAVVELNYEDPDDAVKFVTSIMGHIAVILEKDNVG